MKSFRKLTLGLTLGVSGLVASAANAVEIEYWQYINAGRVDAIDILIENFEAANPDITVKHVNFPYADYQLKVSAAVFAGKGPDVVQFFYGWLDSFRGKGLIQPISQEAFPHDEIAARFFPIVGAMKRDGEYYGLPTAVRALALFYNKGIMEAAGLDPNKPPATLDELREMSKATTKYNDAGDIESEGIALGMTAQDHHWLREVLIRQFGGTAYSDDNTEVVYDSDAGRAAVDYYMSFEREDKSSQAGFMDQPQAAFKSGRAAFLIDGTFRVPSIKATEGLDFGVTELPSHNGIKSNFASYWANGIATGSEGEELEAAHKWLAYLTSDEAMGVWLEVAGELPAAPALAMTEENLNDPVFGPFLKALEYSHATQFYNETDQRQVLMDMANSILLEGTSTADALAAAAVAEQAIFDDNM
jgi:multiple sugar transport system substrate-binding protein